MVGIIQEMIGNFFAALEFHKAEMVDQTEFLAALLSLRKFVARPRCGVASLDLGEAAFVILAIESTNDTPGRGSFHFRGR
jgi:hypothetical protein